VPVEWNRLRPWNGSQDTAFEELICQLASYEPAPSESTFFRKGTPDAGVECFWKLPKGLEYGWQAKFFTFTPSSSQWRQVDSSVKTALEKHPALKQYTICMAVDRADARLDGKKSFLDRWTEHVRKWDSWAAAKSMRVDFRYWGSHEIAERLSRLAFSTRAFRLGVCNAAQMSFLRCRFSQKSGVLPNTLESINAVSTVTDRLLLQISLIVRRLTPIASANCP